MQNQCLEHLKHEQLAVLTCDNIGMYDGCQINRLLISAYLTPLIYSPARQGWRGIDVLFVENCHLEMLLL